MILLTLAAHAHYALYPSSGLISALRPLTGLLPPQELNPLTVAALRLRVPRAKGKAIWSDERSAALVTLQSLKKPLLDDDHVLAIWPARTKSDLAIRRTRFRDCWQCYNDAGEVKRFWHICQSLPGFDVITVCNILNASWNLSDDTFEWFDFFDYLGAFDSDIEHYIAVAKTVNDLVKKYRTSGFPRYRVTECGGLTGYRNTPFPGFDVIDETKKLADGGGRHGLIPATSLSTFTQLADKLLDTEGEPMPWISFKDFVTSGDWETSGASSVGRVEWSHGGVAGKSFKARKNLVPDVVDLDDLASRAYDWAKQENKSMIKSELGKLRVAVSGDMEMYLEMSWLTRYLGGCYKKWPGSTIEEDVTTQTDRMIDMLQAISQAWNLPFDYASFDHQPNTDELKAIVNVLIRNARRNISTDNMAEFDHVASNVLTSFDNATISVSDDTEKKVFPVEGGVMSGLRWTTILGNAWNTVMTAWVMHTMNEMGVETRDIKRWIRGDDSAIVTSSYCEALLFRLGYEAIGAIGSDGKFGIHYGASEFLRVWYDRYGCHGYPARALPGLLQRKPWSSSPWEEESVMGHIYDSLRTLRRRGCDSKRLEVWWRAVKRVWSQRNHVSQVWLQIPKERGGLGIEPWDGRSFVRERWPKTNTLVVEVTNATGWRRDKLVKHYSTFLPITDQEGSNLATELVAKKLASDDIPALNSLYRQLSQKPRKTLLEIQQPRWNIPALNEIVVQTRLLASVSAKRGALERALQAYSLGSFGYYAFLAQKWQDVSAVDRLRKNRSTLKWFEVNYPDFYIAVKQLERKGLSRSEALDWCFGTTPINITKQVHPALSSLLHKAVISVAQGFVLRTKLKPRELSQIIAAATSALEPALLSSELSQVVYSW